MKPITNILLVLSIVCYAFLPLYDLAFQGSMTGFSFTASSITQYPTVRHIAFALVPFWASFLAIGFNTLRNRWWSIASVALILVGLYFFNEAYHFKTFHLLNDPEVQPFEGIGEAFEVTGLGIGFLSSCTLMVLSLISAIMSLLPFDFNFTLERAVDATIDRSIEDVKSITHWRGHHDAKRKRGAQHNDDAPAVADQSAAAPIPPPLPPVDPEDNSRFMPK